MKIERRRDGAARQPLRDELQAFLHRDRPTSAICAPDCPDAGPGGCSRRCPDIARMLSSEPETYPLESRIAPLVYELKRLEVFQPCWSCEGHNGPDGAIWKIPSVWFYCNSVVHLRVLASTLSCLHQRNHLSRPWRVALTFSDSDNPETTFALEPCIDEPEQPLAPLQQDIPAMAERLHDSFLEEARKLSLSAGSA